MRVWIRQLRTCWLICLSAAGLDRPGAVLAEDGKGFSAALDALPGVPVIVSSGDRPGS